MNGSADKSAELIGRLERLPFSRWHRNFFILAFLGVMFDAADFALFGAALPPIAREFGLNPAQAGLLATVGLVGAFVGALFWGVRLHRPPHRVSGNRRDFCAVHRFGGGILECALVERLPLPVQLRA